MPIITDFKLPSSPDKLTLPPDSTSPFFVAFLASPDPNTGEPWCPDVRAALPHLKAAFSGQSAHPVAFVEVGQRAEWKDPSNPYRTVWKVAGVPTLVRYERVDGKVQDAGRITEVEILNQSQFKGFIKASL